MWQGPWTTNHSVCVGSGGEGGGGPVFLLLYIHDLCGNGWCRKALGPPVTVRSSLPPALYPRPLWKLLVWHGLGPPITPVRNSHWDNKVKITKRNPPPKKPRQKYKPSLVASIVYSLCVSVSVSVSVSLSLSLPPLSLSLSLYLSLSLSLSPIPPPSTLSLPTNDSSNIFFSDNRRGLKVQFLVYKIMTLALPRSSRLYCELVRGDQPT